MLPRLRTSASGDALWLLVGSVLTPWIAYATEAGGIGRSMRFDVPTKYSEDAVAAAAQMKALLEGSPFSSPRLGYPFGANWLDFPTLDDGTLIVARVLGFLTPDYGQLFNALFLTGFTAAFIAAFVVARRLGVGRPLSFVVGFAYSLASYHFARADMFGHLLLTWYWVAPVFVLIGWRVAEAEPRWTSRRTRFLGFLGTALLAGFGTYYTAFGLITIVAAIAFGITSGRGMRSVRAGVEALAAVGVGIVAQLIPLVMHRLEAGPNPAAFPRSAVEADYFGFRVIQLLLPQIDHRIPSFAERALSYKTELIGKNETVMSSLGVLASVGFAVAAIMLVLALAGQAMEARLRYLGAMTLTFTAFGMLGGLGMITAMTLTTGIRSWNRMSIFIAFTCLVVFAIALEPSLTRATRRASVVATVLALFGTAGIVVIDQTPRYCAACVEIRTLTHDSTADFVHRLEATLPAGAALYQMPYVAFPEGMAWKGDDRYSILKPYLESSSLRFNLGGMKGREADRFYRALAQRSITTQIAVARRLGFAGIYIDRTGYRDGGTEVLRELTEALGAATYRPDGRIAFFRLTDSAAPLPVKDYTLQEMYALAQFDGALRKPPRAD